MTTPATRSAVICETADRIAALPHERPRRVAVDGITDAPADAVLVVDGSFLQKPAIRGSWDHVVYLRATFEAAEARGVRRDAELLGGTDAATAAFRNRYHAAQRRYLAECDPEAGADVVIDHENPSEPTTVRSVPPDPLPGPATDTLDSSLRWAGRPPNR